MNSAFRTGGRLRPVSSLRSYGFLIIAAFCLTSYYYLRPSQAAASFSNSQSSPSKLGRPIAISNTFAYNTSPGSWTKVIWQTSRVPLPSLESEHRDHYESWNLHNPDYIHELLTDERMDEYVRRKHNGTEAHEVYFKLENSIMRSHLLSYLILMADGGVYSDIDVACEHPIESWLPSRLAQRRGIGAVLGVGIDSSESGISNAGGPPPFALVNWTLLAKPGHAFLEYLVRRIVENLQRAFREHDLDTNAKTSTWQPTVQEVLSTTGPAAVTAAVLEYTSSMTASTVTAKNFSKISEPVEIAGVVILPIHAFGAAHQVELAGLERDPQKAMVHHYLRGSWQEDHYRDPANPAYTQEGLTEVDEEEEEVVIVEEKVVEMRTAFVTATQMHGHY